MGQNLQEIGRNNFDAWCWRRGLDLRDVAAGLKVAEAELRRRDGRERRVPSIETIRLIRLPFTDRRRRVPAQDVMDLIRVLTGGEIVAADFYAPTPTAVSADAVLAAP